jgi:serine/threonine protein phosphatase 1
MARTFVIGDIHGAAKALDQVLKRAKFDFENDTLISVGDVADGWPEVPQAIELLLSIKNLIYLRGNHDAWASEFLQADTMSLEYDSWMYHGGAATKKSYSEEPVLQLIDKHIEFLRSADLYYLDDKNRLFMHAGFFPKQTEFMDIWQKCYRNDFEPKDLDELKRKSPDSFFWDREFWSGMYIGRNFAKHFHEVYIGHTPTLNYPQADGSQFRPMQRRNVWNMDTGCCYYGPLSLMDIDTKQVYQSDAVLTLYPNHPGRNGTSWSELNKTNINKLKQPV